MPSGHPPGAFDRREYRSRRRARLRRERRLAALAALVVLAAAAFGLYEALRPSAPPRAAPAAPAAARHRAPARAEHAARPGKLGTEAVPILMYHVLAPPPPTAPYPGLYVPAPEFAAQMQALKRAGYRAVTMDQVWASWHRGVPLPPGRPIVLSFDNGYRTQFSVAMPVLRKLGWVGVENIQLTGLPPSQGGLGPWQVRQLLKAGWELDTQGFSHADLVALGATALHHEVAESRAALRHRYGVPVNWFCYPSGHYDATVLAAVRAAGYHGSTTVLPGWARPGDDPYRLPRLRVLGGTSPGALLAQIAGAASAAPAPPSYGS